MTIAPALFDTTAACALGVPTGGADTLPVLDKQEISFERTGNDDTDLQRPRQGRRIATATLGLWKLRHLVDDTALLVTELLTNAYMHGSGEAVRLRLVLTERYIRVEVCTESSGVPRVQSASTLEEHGRGLFLVKATADAWGITDAGVWCIVRRDAEEAEVSC